MALGVLLALLTALFVLAAALYLRSWRRQRADSKDPEAGKTPGAHQVCSHANVCEQLAQRPASTCVLVLNMGDITWVLADARPGNLFGSAGSDKPGTSMTK